MCLAAEGIACVPKEREGNGMSGMVSLKTDIPSANT